MYILEDYQILAIFMIGFCIGTFVLYVVDELRSHPEWNLLDVIRDFSDAEPVREPRIVRSDDHCIK